MSITSFIIPTSKEISQRKIELYHRYSRIQQWGLKYPVEYCSRIMGIELLDMQKYAIYNSWTKDFVLWLESRNAGKALALDTIIPTPNGNTTMGEIEIGDLVFNEFGKPIKVIGVSEVFLNHKCYEVQFDDGEKIIADNEHLWVVQTKSNRRTINRIPKTERKRAGFDEFDEFGYKTLQTSDMFNDYYHKRKDGKGIEYKYRVPIASPLEYDEKDLPIHPYILGLWIGDGESNGNRITCSIEDLENTKDNILECGYTARINYNKNRCPSISINPNNSSEKFRSALNRLGLLGNKHIPEVYFKSSIHQRIELLQGLMDSDGCCEKNSYCTFSQKSHNMILQVSRLLNSLCIKHSIKKKNSKCNDKTFESYIISFYSDKTFSCFKLRRKYDKLKGQLHNRSKNKTILSIKEVGSVPTRCIKVDNPRGLFLCGEKNTVTHNTTKLAIYSMLRSLLIPYHITYFLGNTGDQAKEVFKKVEKIAKREIESFVGGTDIFENELVKNGPTSDGFLHNPAGFSLRLFNGSEINTLNSDITNIKGRRASLVCFDEAGWFSDELFLQAEQFVNQDENFKLGAGIDVDIEPKGFPRQLLYASSASDTSSEFYKKFRNFSDRMFIGDKRYFVCNYNIDLVMSATYNGEPYPPLISKDKVEQAMADNRDKALRELYNKFSSGNYEGQILTRRDVMQYTERRPPLFLNDTGNRLMGAGWDAARLNDNSVIIWAEFELHPEKGWMMHIHNVVSLVDIKTKKKTPMRFPEQVDKFKDMLIDYNANEYGKLDYENIKIIICDSGSGGNMIGGVADYMVEGWNGKDGKPHKGIIDKSHKANETSAYKFPDAVDIMKLLDPKGNRNDIMDAIEKMVKLGVVTFPADYDGKEYIISIDDDGNEKKYDLSKEEQLALTQVELLKTEITTMCKYDTKGNISYDLPPEKRNTMPDDRCFAFGLLCWYLQRLRRGHIFERPKQTLDPQSLISLGRKAVIYKSSPKR